MTFFLLLVLASCSGLFAQLGSEGAILGVVTDATGAVVAGAVVTATNLDTGLKRSAASDSAGDFELLALPIGYLSIRRRGIYFSMVTLAFAQMVFYVTNEWRPVTGGENGVQSVPRLLPGAELGSPLTFYYAALPFVLAGLWLAHRIVHSPFGHVLVSIRDNEARAQYRFLRCQRNPLLTKRTEYLVAPNLDLIRLGVGRRRWLILGHTASF